MAKKMIFRDEFTGEQSEIFKKLKFKEFKLPTDVNYTERSLQLIYDMYCSWLNTRHGFYLYLMKLSVDDSLELCGDSLLDYLFHRVQGDIEHRDTGSDKSISLVSTTYREGTKTIHEGFFLMPMTEAEMTETPRGDKSVTPKSVHRIFSRILTQFHNNEFVEVLDLEEDALDLRFRYSDFGEGYEAIYKDSSFEVHEQGFNILCELAELPKEKSNIEPVLFRTWYGYNPYHSYFCTSIFEPFFFHI